MRFKVENNILTEASLSRIHSKVNDPNVSFAVIGTNDQNTNENRWSEFRDKMLNLNNSLGKTFGYNIFKGNYTYEDGTTTEEFSAIVYDIPKDVALKIAKELNQESIIWKDKDFFGFINVATGREDNDFTDRTMSFDQMLSKLYGSKLLRDNRRFIFK